MASVEVALPTHLRRLAGVDRSVVVEVGDEPSLADVLDALEAAHPALRGTIRDQATGERRAFMRYFLDGLDASLEDPATALPEAVASGREPVRIVGAIAGG